MSRTLAAARWLISHARAQMAVKSALAAALAWVAAETVTRVVPGELEHYMYYAPLGAVVATYPTIIAAARTAWQSLWALSLGAGLGLAVHLALDPGLLSLALVVGVGVGLGALPGLGEQRSWVPIVALFVLVVGGSQPLGYAAAYVGLTALGALCGVAVNVLLPALPLQQGDRAVERLRQLLADQLSDVAAGLRDQTPPGRQAWQRRRRLLDVQVEHTRTAVGGLLQSERGNLRARFHRQEVRRQDEVAAVLERVAVLVNDLMGILNETHRDDLSSTPLDVDLAVAVADALEQLRELVLGYDLELTSDDPRVLAVVESMRRLTAEFDRRRNLDPDDFAVLGAVVANLRWSTAAIQPA
jgi:uncharacterized membrane protein YgaE (UPF0421/DUF939 family)